MFIQVPRLKITENSKYILHYHNWPNTNLKSRTSRRKAPPL